MVLTVGHFKDPAGRPEHGEAQHDIVAVDLILGKSRFDPHGDANRKAKLAGFAVPDHKRHSFISTILKGNDTKSHRRVFLSCRKHLNLFASAMFLL